jgi:hypothetical protein
MDGRCGGSAHLRALLGPALSDVHEYSPQPASLALHPTCTQTHHTFRPLPAATDRSCLPVSDVLRITQYYFVVALRRRYQYEVAKENHFVVEERDPTQIRFWFAESESSINASRGVLAGISLFFPYIEG